MKVKNHTPSINTYLSQAKKQIAHTGLVVIGNEAADLDSMASAIAYGYLRNLQDATKLVLPIVSIPRADFILRPEAVYVFKEAGIDLSKVIFIDDIDFEQLMETAELVLVDHNRLSMPLEKYGDQVVSIVDHHWDEGLYGSANPRIIETVGSTTSLVAREFRRGGIEIRRDVAILLTGTILLDTVNLADDMGRVTDTDKDIAAVTLPLCHLSQQVFFENVCKEKYNVTGFSTNDLLRKDYKEWQFGRVRCGIASALLPAEEWYAMDSNLTSGFTVFADKRGLDLLVCMNAYFKPGFTRELVLCCRSKDEHDAFLNYLQENELQLTLLDHFKQKENDRGIIRFYKQENLEISRKKLQPLLADYYK